MCVLEHHQPPVLLAPRHAHTASTAPQDALNVRPDTLWVPYTRTTAALGFAGKERKIRARPQPGDRDRARAFETGKTQFNKLQKRLCRNVGKALADYHMIEAGDREIHLPAIRAVNL